MTNAEKKKKLREYKWIDKQIKADYAELDDLVTLIQSPNLDGLPSTPNSERDLADLLVKKDEILARILDDISRKEKARRRINDALDAMWNETERLVLIYRYKQGMKWEDIANKIPTSIRQVYYIHGAALTHIDLH